MRTREEQEAINKACKYHPETYRELSILINDPKVNLGEIDTSKITDMSNLFAFKYRERTDFSGIENWDTSHVTDMSGMFYCCDRFNQEYDDDDDVIDVDLEEEYLVLVNLEDCTGEFYEQNDFDRETLKDGFEHLEEKINKFLTELKQARADREKQQGLEFSLEQKQSKGRCR